MFYIKKRIEIAGSHKLKLSYPSKCSSLHGHNWIITIYCRAEELNEDGMVVDFSAIKNSVEKYLDHKDLNAALGSGVNPTAENLAKWIQERVVNCYKVKVRESEGNEAIYEARD